MAHKHNGEPCDCERLKDAERETLREGLKQCQEAREAERTAREREALERYIDFFILPVISLKISASHNLQVCAPETKCNENCYVRLEFEQSINRTLKDFESLSKKLNFI